MAIHTLSMFTGAAMLDVGLELAFGEIFRPVAYVECEAFAVAVLAEAMEQGRIHPAPVWSDARSVCGAQFRHYIREAGGVDAIVAGYPCPDFSCAGRRAGMAGPKGALWWNLAESIAEYEPELLFLENVGGHTSKGFDTVCSSLRSMDYRIAAGLFTAAEVGASQSRERLFIMADRDGARESQPQGPVQEQRGRFGDRGEELAGPAGGKRGSGGKASRGNRRDGKSHSDTHRPGKELVGANGDRRKRNILVQETKLRRAETASVSSGPQLVDASRAKFNRRFRQSGATCAGGEPRTERPGPQLAVPLDGGFQAGKCGRLAGLSLRWKDQRLQAQGPGRKLAGANGPGLGIGRRQDENDLPVTYSLPLFPPHENNYGEWRRVLEIAPSLEPEIYKLADGMADRTHQLRLLGNGCHPLAVAYGFTTLAASLWG